MKKATWFILLLLSVSSTLEAQRDLKSIIKTAQVYTQGAQIERTAKATLKPGKNELKLGGLSATLDPNTIQIGGEGFTILSVRHEIDYINDQNEPEKLRLLEADKQALTDSVKLIELELKILTQQLELLDENRDITGSTGIKNDDFQAAMKYFTARYESLTRKIFKHKQNRGNLAKRLVEINKQIKSQGQGDKKKSSNVYLTLDSKTSQKVDLDIRYAVSQAGWFPAYDIRATNTKSDLTLTYKARVFQNSGVDWKNVKLKISSGNLEANATAPQLQPDFLGGFNNYKNETGQITSVSGIVTGADDGLPLPQVTVLLKGTTIGVPTDENGRYKIQVPSYGGVLVVRYLGYVTQEIPINRPVINVQLNPDVAELGEVVVTGYGVEQSLQGRVAGVNIQRERKKLIRGTSSINADDIRKQSLALDIEEINYQTSFVYDIDLPYDIPSSGKPEVVDIKTELIAANYQYIAAPKASAKAYLVAQIADWTDLNLLDGTSNLYFQNSFVGQSIIDTHLGSDTLEVSLGKDEAIIVNRQRKKDFEQKRFFSNKKREERHFEITVMNTKKEEISMIVYDQIPVAVRSDIKVNATELDGGSLDKKTGIVTWEVKLKPGEKRIIKLKYEVDYPRYENININ